MNQASPERYALRVQPRAARDIEAHLLRLEKLAGADVARECRDGLLAAIGTLSENPRRFAGIPEQTRFRYETRQLLYRRAPSGPAWRVLFAITGEEEGSPEPPTVNLLHVQHAAQRPVTRSEAREMEAET